MNQDNIPIIGAPKALHVSLEVPATFQIKMWFINHAKEYTTVDYALPPGVYPNPKWLVKIVEGSTREALKALKLSTKDLSWRKCNPQEFVNATAGGVSVIAAPKWLEPFASEFDLEVPKVKEITQDASL